MSDKDYSRSVSCLCKGPVGDVASTKIGQASSDTSPDCCPSL